MPKLSEIGQNVIDTRLGPAVTWPGNVRELEQCVCGILLRGAFTSETAADEADIIRALISGIEEGTIVASSLVSGYCRLLYQRYNNFEEVARRTGLDSRTVKKTLPQRGGRGRGRGIKDNHDRQLYPDCKEQS